METTRKIFNNRVEDMSSTFYFLHVFYFLQKIENKTERTILRWHIVMVVSQRDTQKQDKNGEGLEKHRGAFLVVSVGDVKKKRRWRRTRRVVDSQKKKKQKILLYKGAGKIARLYQLYYRYSFYANLRLLSACLFFFLLFIFI